MPNIDVGYSEYLSGEWYGFYRTPYVGNCDTSQILLVEDIAGEYFSYWIFTRECFCTLSQSRVVATALGRMIAQNGKVVRVRVEMLE